MTSILLPRSKVNNIPSLFLPEDYVNSLALCHNNLAWTDLDHLGILQNNITVTLM